MSLNVKQYKIIRVKEIPLTQLSHDVRTTLLRGRISVVTSFQRPYNVVLTSCASWVKVNDLSKIKICGYWRQSLGSNYTLFVFVLFVTHRSLFHNVKFRGGGGGFKIFHNYFPNIGQSYRDFSRDFPAILIYFLLCWLVLKKINHRKFCFPWFIWSFFSKILKIWLCNAIFQEWINRIPFCRKFQALTRKCHFS